MKKLAKLAKNVNSGVRGKTLNPNASPEEQQATMKKAGSATKRMVKPSGDDESELKPMGIKAAMIGGGIILGFAIWRLCSKRRGSPKHRATKIKNKATFTDETICRPLRDLVSFRRFRENRNLPIRIERQCLAQNFDEAEGANEEE